METRHCFQPENIHELISDAGGFLKKYLFAGEIVRSYIVQTGIIPRSIYSQNKIIRHDLPDMPYASSIQTLVEHAGLPQ